MLLAVTHPACSVSCNLAEAIRGRNSAKFRGVLPGLPEPYRLHPFLLSKQNRRRKIRSSARSGASGTT